MGLVSQKK